MHIYVEEEERSLFCCPPSLFLYIHLVETLNVCRSDVQQPFIPIGSLSLYIAFFLWSPRVTMSRVPKDGKKERKKVCLESPKVLGLMFDTHT